MWKCEDWDVLPQQAKPTAWTAVTYDDSSWSLIDTPHDMLITGERSAANDPKQSFLPRGVGYYRKHFKLPAEWSGRTVSLYVEGAFHETSVYLNGARLLYHAAGYTSFWVRLDDAGAVWGGSNVLAIRVNASSGTGWWYEGGGLMRHNYLVAASPLHIAPDSAWVHANVSASRRAPSASPPPASAPPRRSCTAKRRWRTRSRRRRRRSCGRPCATPPARSSARRPRRRCRLRRRRTRRRRCASCSATSSSGASRGRICTPSTSR